MQSLRRATLRSAASVSRAVATKPQTVAIASRLARNVNVSKAFSIASARSFSQTFRVASEDAVPANSEQALDIESGETPYGIFIRNMVFDANEEHLREAFEKYGTITKIAIARDARGLSRGFAFLWFAKEEEMKAAFEVDGMFWHGRRLQIAARTGRAQKRGNDSGPTRSLYIGNIPYETTDAQLNDLFRDLENVLDVRVAVDRATGWPRGFAHVDFADEESCTAALSALQGQSLSGRPLRFDYAAASGKGNAPKGSTGLSDNNSFQSS